jgi:transglutaminase/protease-like cytokinesis protein 3
MIDTYSKIKFIYDEIVNEASFDDISEGSISALLNGSSSSYGFAATFKYLCSKSGLNAIIVDGSYSEYQHFWNLVEVEDTWYAVDCSLGRITFDELADTFFTGYDYFLVDDSIIFTTHTADYYDDGWKYPGCTNGFYEYYRTNNLRFSEFSNAADYTVEAIQNGNTFITLAFTDDISYNEALYEIEVSKDSKFWAYISYKTSIENSAIYYTHNDDTRRISLLISQ